MKQILSILTICFLTIVPSGAQDFKWLKGIGSRYDNEVASCILAEKDLGSTVLISRTYSNTSALDTIFFDSIHHTFKPSGRQWSMYLAKLDKSGKTAKSVYLGNYHSESFCRDDSGNYYVIGSLYDTFTFKVGMKYMKPTNGLMVIVKYDKNFNVVWQAQHNQNGTGNKIHHSNGRIFFTTTGSKTIYGEITKDSCKIKWSKNLGNIGFYVYSIATLNNNIYLGGEYAYIKVVLNGDTFPEGSGFVVRTDSAGNYIKGFVLKSKSSSGIQTICTDGINLFIGGRFGDTVQWGGRKISPQYPNPGNNWNEREMFAASLAFDLKPRWFYRPKLLNQIRGSGFLYISTYSDQFIYWGGRLLSPILVNGDTVRNPFIVLKTDLTGNVMWASSGGSSDGAAYSLSAIAGKVVYLSGLFDNTIQFGSKTVQSRGQGDALLVQLSDNAIIRGIVSYGPYCAGDTIRIPYKKIGNYNSSNRFLAELSDEDGEFNGKEIKLGSLQSDTDGIIIGRLPLFQVSTSPNYRIRIISTLPAVQSYYKADTLRLLIYSKDKAAPGNDTLICKGDSVALKTFGGSKWQWSPAYRMKDSTARETIVWPDKTTTYKIVIADSSGCGEPDTAYKTIEVRKELKSTLKPLSDTLACKSSSFKLSADFKGGDSSNYTWYWAAIASNGNYTLLKSGSKNIKDTLIYKIPDTESDSVVFFVFLYDNCTAKSTFARQTVYIVKNKAKVAFANLDTALCPGKPTEIIVKFSSKDSSFNSWQWQERNQFNQWINRQNGSKQTADTIDYSLALNWKGTKALRVLLRDNCSGLDDTAVLKISPRDTLKLSLSSGDTTLCKGQTHTWKAKGSEGYAPGYQFLWTDLNTGDTLSTEDSFSLIASNNKSIQIRLTDGCMPKAIQKSFTIVVYPELNSDILFNNKRAKDTALCYGQSIEYKASALGGKGSNYNYRWLLGSELLSTQNRLILNVNDYKTLAGSKVRLLLITSDGCTLPYDSSETEIDLLAPLSQSVIYPDSICYGNTVNFISSATGGRGNYNFKWTDAGNNKLIDSSRYFYMHSGNQTGNIVRNAIVSDGCSFNDTITVNSELLAPLRLSLSVSDPCPVNTLTLSAAAGGGKKANHLIRWYENGLIFGSGNSISINTYGLPKTISAILSDGCSLPPDTQTLNTGSRPGVQISASGICLGDKTSLLASSTNFAKAQTYLWRIDDILQSTTDSTLQKTFAAIGSYSIKVMAISSGNCNGSDSVVVEIISKPKADFDYVHFNSQTPIPFQFNNRSLYSQSWTWDFGTGDTSMRKNPLYKFRDTGRFKIMLIAANLDKCFDTAVQILPVYPSIEFYFPNVFSPNGNNINERFGLHPAQWFMVQEYNLKIFNRWGEMVFNSDHMEELWDGERAQQGVYIWKADIRDVYNVLHELRGVVEVMR